MKRRRLASLLQAEMSLLAYHLPLDAHSVYGNNVQLARVLGMAVQGWLTSAPVFYGDLSEAYTGEAFASRIAQSLGRPPLYIPGASLHIRKIAWCSGAAQNYIHEAMAAGADTYLTGEASEATVHVARETGMHFYAAGHHATERYGIAALGEHLAARFGLDHSYIEIDNPV
jgi:dinuclear metal center YbgI/SA1388 family protein